MRTPTPSRIAREPHGFTLIEIMIAITIFAMVLTAIYSSWSAILRASKVGLAAATEAQRSRVTVRALEDALACAQYFPENAAYYSFEADTTGDYSTLSFVARLPASFPGSGLFPGQPLRRLFFQVKPGENSVNQLVLSQIPLLQPLEAGTKPYELVLAPQVNQFTLEFWDYRKGVWATEWLSTNQIPPMIKVSLGFGERTQPKIDPSQVTTRIIGITPTLGRLGPGPQSIPSRTQQPSQPNPPIQ